MWLINLWIKWHELHPATKASSAVATGGAASFVLMLGYFSASMGEVKKDMHRELQDKAQSIIEMQAIHNADIYQGISELKEVQKDGFQQTNKRLDKLYELQLQRSK